MALMDRFRARIVKQQVASPEEKKKQQRAILVPNIVSLLFDIAMVVIGYQNNGLCENDAPLYLLIGGGLNFGMTLLKIVAVLTPSDCDDKFANGVTPFASLFSFGVMIWGSFVVFGAYSSWSYEEKDQDNKDLSYCPYTPFMFAFVILILEWVLKPFLACCECCLACSSCCTFMSPPVDSATEYTAAATTDSPETATSIIKQQSEKC
jgi:hypothetical protein